MALRIENAIDLHCHFGPDTLGGTLEHTDGHSVTALEAAQQAAASGHRALVLKSHSFASPALASNIQSAVPELQVFGGICTDYPSGGLNVAAVEAALALGAKIVWLPTVHSHQDFLNPTANRLGFGDGSGLRVTDEDDALLPAVQEIFALVRQKNAILATGHISADEHHAVVKAFGRQGHVLVTHAGEELAGPHLSADQCRELAELGATIELTALTCQSLFGNQGKDPQETARVIHHVGPQHCALATDYGWTTHVPKPAAGLREFLEALWEVGISEEDLNLMVSANPARLLGLDL